MTQCNLITALDFNAGAKEILDLTQYLVVPYFKKKKQVSKWLH